MDAIIRQAQFSAGTPLYVASGLLTGSTDNNHASKQHGDPESTEEVKSLVKDILDSNVRV